MYDDVLGQPTIWDVNAATDVNSSIVGNPYMFTGRRYDDETGLYYYRARYYDPYIGRFMQPDPVAMYMQYASVSQRTRDSIPGTYLFPSALQKFMQYDPIGRYLQIDPAGRFLQNMRFGAPVELNLYTYVGNNPIIFIDPEGHGKRLRRASFIFWIYVNAVWEGVKEVFSIPDLKKIKETYGASKEIVRGMREANRLGRDATGFDDDFYPPFRDQGDDGDGKK